MFFSISKKYIDSYNNIRLNTGFSSNDFADFHLNYLRWFYKQIFCTQLISQALFLNCCHLTIWVSFQTIFGRYVGINMFSNWENGGESVEEKCGDSKSFLIERAEHTMIWVVKCEPFYQRNTEESANTLRLLRIFRSVWDLGKVSNIRRKFLKQLFFIFL